jgi:hypothetical protein
MPSGHPDERLPHPGTGRRQAFEGDFLRLLLAVIGQDLITSLGELGAILLQAAQNDEVGVVHYRTAEFLDVVSAGFLLLRRAAALLLGDGTGRDRQRQQGDYQDQFTHRVPLFYGREVLNAEAFLKQRLFQPE